MATNSPSLKGLRSGSVPKGSGAVLQQGTGPDSLSKGGPAIQDGRLDKQTQGKGTVNLNTQPASR